MKVFDLKTMKAYPYEERLQSGQCLITEPATLSMQSDTGVRLMGTQIFKAGVTKNVF